MPCPFRKYGELLGLPNEGVHKYRFLDTAIVDYVLTLLAAMAISYVSRRKVPLVLSTVVLFITGEILHILFGIPTQTTTFMSIRCRKK